MQLASEALTEIKGLYREIFDRPAPDIQPGSFVEFPAGVDPVQHALGEARQLKQLTAQLASAPRPGTWVPPADIHATPDAYVLRIGVFGIPRDRMKVLVKDGECVVRGERKVEETGPEMRPVSLELPRGPFERRFSLPPRCSTKEMKARYVDGVLELTIPLAGEEAKGPSVIDIK